MSYLESPKTREAMARGAFKAGDWTVTSLILRNHPAIAMAVVAGAVSEDMVSTLGRVLEEHPLHTIQIVAEQMLGDIIAAVQRQ